MVYIEYPDVKLFLFLVLISVFKSSVSVLWLTTLPASTLPYTSISSTNDSCFGVLLPFLCFLSTPQSTSWSSRFIGPSIPEFVLSLPIDNIEYSFTVHLYVSSWYPFRGYWKPSIQTPLDPVWVYLFLSFQSPSTFHLRLTHLITNLFGSIPSIPSLLHPRTTPSSRSPSTKNTGSLNSFHYPL